MHLLLCVSLKLNNVYLYIQKTWEVPGGPGSWVGKSKLSPHSGSVALRQLNPLINMSCKVFFKSKSFKLNMTDWPCYAWLQKELVWPTNKVVTYFYAPIWKIGLCVLYHQTKMLTFRKNWYLSAMDKVFSEVKKCVENAFSRDLEIQIYWLSKQNSKKKSIFVIKRL